MANLPRLLSRRPRIDEAELESVRARTVERLAAFSDTGAPPETTDVVATGEVVGDGEAIKLGPPVAIAVPIVVEPPKSVSAGVEIAVDPDASGATAAGLAAVTTSPKVAAPSKAMTKSSKPKANRSRQVVTAVPVMAEVSPSVSSDSFWPSDWAKGAIPVDPAPVQSATAQPDLPRRDPSLPAPRYTAIADVWETEEATPPDPGPSPAPVVAAIPVIPVVVESAVELPTVAPRPKSPPTKRHARPVRHAAAIVQAPSAVPAQPTIRATPAVATFCPYCALALDPPPTSSRRCVRCRQRIVVKRVQGRTVYLTEAAVDVFESERLRSVNFGRWSKERAQWLKLATSVGAPADRITRLDRAPLSEGVVASARTLYLSTAERNFREAKRNDRWEDASRLKRDQAAALYRLAGSPVPPPETVVAMHRDAAAAELRGIGRMAKEAGLIGATCCETCQADDGRTFRIATELKVARLPHDGCPKGLCRCRWDLAMRDRTMVQRYLRRTVRASKAPPPSG